MGLGRGKTEHGGAKNGGGGWGRRRDAKRFASKTRRLRQRRELQDARQTSRSSTDRD